LNFAVIDIIFVGLIGLFMIRCYLKGFVSELMSVAGIVLGIIAALFFYKNLGEFLRERFFNGMKIVPEIAAFAILFILVLIIVKIIEVMLKGVIEGISLGGLDRILGLVFGLAEGLAVISLVLFLLKIMPIDTGFILDDSIFARLLLPLITGKESVDV
jgi:membrane protein required for colicin V production